MKGLHVVACLLGMSVGAALPMLARAADAPPNAKKVITRESDPLRDKYEEWADSGFRLHLSIGYAHIGGGPSSPTMNTVDTSVSVGWRFTQSWGLMATFRYGALFEGFAGLRWATTIEPFYFITDGLVVSAGLGLGGLMGGRNSNNELGLPYSINYSRYVSDPDKIVLRDPDEVVLGGEPNRVELPPFPSCDGDAFVAVVRVAYLFTVGDLFSTGPVLQADGQWTVCQDHGFDRHVPIEERHLTPKQLWGHYAIGLGWSAVWR